LTVGLLNALHAYKGELASPVSLAVDACRIEIEKLEKPIGKQDQYAAAFGGLNYITFHAGGDVHVSPVPHDPAVMRELERHCLLLYTQGQRKADDILEKQSAGTGSKMNLLCEMRDLASSMRDTLTGPGNLDQFANLLHEGWEMKRSLGFGISNERIDDWYAQARRVGVTGGKLLGAGGGGFLLLFAPPERHDAIRQALGNPRELPFRADPRGSRIIFISDRYAF